MPDFQIVVLSSEEDIPHEIDVLHQLFEEGLVYYHLRKPHKNYEEHCDFLERIDAKYHQYIVPHFYHELLQTYDLKGIHFKEQKRKEALEKNKSVDEYLHSIELKNKSITLSSSFHEPECLKSCTIPFDYHFLSPIFSSISKVGYEGKHFEVGYIKKKTIGMGGVRSNNIADFIHLGFQGVGVLGGIWKNENPIQEFKAIVRASRKVNL